MYGLADILGCFWHHFSTATSLIFQNRVRKANRGGICTERVPEVHSAQVTRNDRTGTQKSFRIPKDDIVLTAELFASAKTCEAKKKKLQFQTLLFIKQTLLE